MGHIAQTLISVPVGYVNPVEIKRNVESPLIVRVLGMKNAVH